jgi:hypothetical protein
MSEVSFETFARQVIHALKEIETDLKYTTTSRETWFNFLEDELDLDLEIVMPYRTYEDFVDGFIAPAMEDTGADRTAWLCSNTRQQSYRNWLQWVARGGGLGR